LRQAAFAGGRLRSEKIAAVYASDLSRAVQTAEGIAGPHGLTVRTDADLRECAFGDWEGLTVTEIAERYPELYRNYLGDSVTHRAPSGERLEHLRERVARAVESIARNHPEETVVVVTHGGPIRAFLCHAFGAELSTFRKIATGNCGITVFSRAPEGRWVLEALNDTSHLYGAKPCDEQAQAEA
jgi:broad specificity phosphatase PhoE